MKIKFYVVLGIFALLVLSGCSQQKQPEKIYPTNEVKDFVIISLDKINNDKTEHKYEIYNSGKYTSSLINPNKQENKNEGQLAEADLSYLKSLVQNKEFNSIPPYMEGAGQDCTITIIKTNFNDQEKTNRAESCASTPDAFNNVVAAIEKLK